MSYYRLLIIVIMGTYRENKTKHYKILLSVAFSLFNDGKFHCLQI